MLAVCVCKCDCGCASKQMENRLKAFIDGACAAVAFAVGGVQFVCQRHSVHVLDWIDVTNLPANELISETTYLHVL